jgi:hypothetical protein
MSTIIASNISDGTTSVASTYVVNGSAKAWVNFNGTGTVAIRDSLNVGSITDNGTGDYTSNFTAAMSDANYAFLGQKYYATNDNGKYAQIGHYDGTQIAASCRFRILNPGVDVYDSSLISVAIFR